MSDHVVTNPQSPNIERTSLTKNDNDAMGSLFQDSQFLDYSIPHEISSNLLWLEMDNDVHDSNSNRDIA